MNTYGINIKLKIYGGSHDEKIGMTLDGIPSGEHIDLEALYAFMSRRAPGKDPYSTKRKEPDKPILLSGLDDNGVTSGERIEAVIYNTNQHSGDYASLVDIPRPSHADYAARMKYGESVDLRGGGHFSGRLTAPMCIAGGICLQILEKRGISIAAHISSVGNISDESFDKVSVSSADLTALRARPFPTISEAAEQKMRAEIEKARLEGDSVGGTVECAAIGLPVGWGEHMFCGVEGRIAAIIFGIPAVKGLEFGLGFASSALLGSQNNDPFETDGEHIYTKTNNCGGILGGMTNGMPLILRAALKPTPSIAKEQDSISLSRKENVKLVIGGRHDPCIVPRAVPVLEAATAIALVDMMLDK